MACILKAGTVMAYVVMDISVDKMCLERKLLSVDAVLTTAVEVELNEVVPFAWQHKKSDFAPFGGSRAVGALAEALLCAQSRGPVEMCSGLACVYMMKKDCIGSGYSGCLRVAARSSLTPW